MSTSRARTPRSHRGLPALIIAFLFSSAALTQDAKNPDFFPLVAKATYTYAATFKGTKSEYVIVVKPFTGKDVKGFYFEPKTKPARKNPIIGSATFGLGAYHPPPRLGSWEAAPPHTAGPQGRGAASYSRKVQNPCNGLLCPTSGGDIDLVYGDAHRTLPPPHAPVY